MDKYCSNQLLGRANIPIPKAVLLRREEFATAQWQDKLAVLSFPVVIKPFDGSHGTDVICNINSVEELRRLLSTHFKSYTQILIETFHGKLNSYRILLFRNKILGVVLRKPATLIGDGVHNLERLAALTNSRRQEINSALGPIVFDEEVQIRLKELGITKSYIPSSGEELVLAYTSNAGRGGTFSTINTKICKENKDLFKKIAQTLNLSLVGIDVECRDLNIPITESQGVIIEVNHLPSMRIHELPMSGTPQWVTKHILYSLIFRHPISYIHHLYANGIIAPYVRCVLLILTLILLILVSINF